MKLGVRGLRDDLVHKFEVRVITDPVRDHLTQELTLFGFGCGKHLHPGYIDHTEFFLLNG